MDHTSQQHLSELDRAEELAYAGHEEEALAICFKLRLQASLAVYLRASVNLLMAILIEEPVREKYARECIDLLDILVQKHEHEDNIEKQLEHVEELNELGSPAATPIAPPAQGSEGGKLAVLDVPPPDTPTPVPSTQTKPSSPPQPFTSSSQRASSYPPISVVSPAQMK